jgi:hypothetical protein
MKAMLLLVALAVSLAVARANVNFTIYMTGAQESPANGSLAAGGGIATFDSTANTIDLSVFFVGLSAPATASHIHVGAMGGPPGPVIVSFVPYTPAATGGSIVGVGLAFPVANIPDLMAGNTYFNIHDSVYPGGEIRGQLIPVVVPEPSTLALAGLGLAAAGGIAFKRRQSCSR